MAVFEFTQYNVVGYGTRANVGALLVRTGIDTHAPDYLPTDPGLLACMQAFPCMQTHTAGDDSHINAVFNRAGYATVAQVEELVRFGTTGGFHPMF